MMENEKNIKDIIKKLYSDKFLGSDELKEIELWLKGVECNKEVNDWLKMNWEEIDDSQSQQLFDQVRLKILRGDLKLRRANRYKNIVFSLRRIAAVLVIAICTTAIWFVYNNYQNKK